MRISSTTFLERSRWLLHAVITAGIQILSTEMENENTLLSRDQLLYHGMYGTGNSVHLAQP